MEQAESGPKEGLAVKSPAAGQPELPAGLPERVPEAVRQYGDPVLRRRARAIRKINAQVRSLAGQMAAAMYATNGIGLAAPQIGECRRLVVIDVGDGLMTLVNPRVIWSEGTAPEVEGCLSVQGLIGDVPRAERVRVRALDLDGKEITVEGEGLLARVLQHELDHLDGVLFVDRAMSIREAEAEEGAGTEGPGRGDRPIQPGGAAPPPGDAR